MMKKTFLVLVLAVFAVAAFWWGPRASGADAAAVIAQAQALSDQEKFEESNQLLMDLAKQDPDHPDVYWKIAENYYDLGERINIENDKDKKLSMYKQCEAWAKKGYDKNPGLADNAFWMAVGMSQQAQTNGIAVTLLSDRTLARRIEDFYLKSSQAKEYHYRTKNADTISSAYFALGQFYRKVPDFFIVKILMGTKGDINLSVTNCQKAVEMYPKNVEYNKELGVSLLCRGEKDDNDADTAEGKKWLQKAMALPAENALDRIDQSDSKKLLADPSLACGYGRVQQEEVSEDAFKNK
ncbi:MAG TPA: hypothetical protein VM658_06695 [bacterium]|nr:hypothetical protein [bacterium]